VNKIKLTPRELEILKWLSDGKSNWDISVILKRSQRVIKWHAQNFMEKLGAQNRTHAVAIALRRGLFE
jgi:DNA-binding CsgD family transcriptional regulator